MIEILTDFPENVVAFRAHAKATPKDSETILVPAIQAAFERDEHISVYYELAPDFTGFALGALMDEAGVGVAYLSRWTRLAIVGDHDGLRNAVALFHFLFPCPVKVFALKDAANAKAWVSQPTI